VCGLIKFDFTERGNAMKFRWGEQLKNKENEISGNGNNWSGR